MEDLIWDIREFMSWASEDYLYESEMLLRQIGYDDEANLVEKIAKELDAISTQIKEKYNCELPD
jgi:hypothetical protein